LNTLVGDRDLAAIETEFERALAAVETDPPAAVTAACALLESLFQIYIDENGLEKPAKQSIKPLWATVQDNLGLHPKFIEDQDVRRILSGPSSIVDGIGSLRTHAGSAHGRGKKCYHLEARHARLAVHGASTLAVFLLETWFQRS